MSLLPAELRLILLLNSSSHQPFEGRGAIARDQSSLEDRIMSVLDTLRGGLSASALAFILDEQAASVESSLGILQEKGRAVQIREYHARAWMPVGDRPEPDADRSAGLLDRLSEYATLSPAVSIPELIMVIDSQRLPLRRKVVLLLSAIRESDEYGEFSLLTHFVQQFILLDREGLRESEIAEVLTVFQPRRLRGYDTDRAEDFVLDCLPVLREGSLRALGLARLGELELILNKPDAAEEHLSEALELCLRSGCCDHVPAILETMGEIPRDFEAMEQMSREIEDVLKWLDGLEDPELRARTMAAAALAQSGLRMNALAERTILSAMTNIASLSLESQLAVEWCRARIYIASGRRKVALPMLQRALMLAQSVNDQLSVREILGVMIREMRERSGFTLRSLVTILDNVCRKAATGGNVSNRIHALDNLTDMFMRTLQLERAIETAEELSATVGSNLVLREESVSDWCLAYMGFLTGYDEALDRGEALLPGTRDFLRAISDGNEPLEESRSISRWILSSTGGIRIAYALILALEAFAGGWEKSASIIAGAVDSLLGSEDESSNVSWKLSISAMLASSHRYAEDFFQSAQVLARQLDRLLLVWLILRCRFRLEIDRTDEEISGILLLLAELDVFLRSRFKDGKRTDFLRVSGDLERMKSIGLDDNAGTEELLEARNRIQEEISCNRNKIFEISDISSRISGRSEISASLEILGRLMGADRVMALRVSRGEIEIIEGYGSGKWRMPTRELQEVVLGLPQDKILADNFCRIPFGSRRGLVIPLGGSVRRTQFRTILPEQAPVDNYLLVESDSPFPVREGIPEFLIDSLCGQVSASLRLRGRESMAYMDRLTGAVIGYSWMNRLEESIRELEAGQFTSVLLADVDAMEEINGNFGFRAGDGALRSLVEIFRRVLRPNDIIGRIRGNLFGIVLPQTGEDNALSVADRLCGAVAGSDLRPDRVPVTVSIGVAAADHTTDAADMVVNRSADAMRAAKTGGGNRALVWSSDLAGQSQELKVFNTGDPGWDHTVSTSVMQLLSEREPTMDFIVRRLRDALRSELVLIENGRGSSASAGSRFLRNIADEIGSGRVGSVALHQSLLGKYDALSAGLSGGGRLISAWETSGRISMSLRNIFGSLASLADCLIMGME
jgi:diguanylate cyclase (GGDEF)-like protein